MRMTKREREVVSLLAHAWRAFLELGVAKIEHNEFAHVIHQAQNIVLARPAARHYQAVLNRWERLKKAEK